MEPIGRKNSKELKINHLPELVRTFLDSILNNITSYTNSLENLEFSGPTFRSSPNNVTIAYNFYPEKHKLELVYTKYRQIINNSFEEFQKSGELILYESISGKIIDMGNQAFTILKARLFEFYMYEPESVVYCRLLMEENESQNKKWISIDFDIIAQSSWFSDN